MQPLQNPIGSKSDNSFLSGHVSNITDAFWHVTDPSLLFTASQDSTIRIWDVNTPKKQKTVIKVKNDRNVNKLPITAATMDPSGKLIFCGTLRQLYQTALSTGSHQTSPPQPARMGRFKPLQPTDPISNILISTTFW